MANLNFNVNNSLHFPPLPKLDSRPKQPHQQRKIRNHDTAKNVNKDDENKNDQTNCIDVRLNDTLLELIFICLHWKHLAICKCVSKRWNSIISNPNFLRILPFEQYSAFTLYLRGKKQEYFLEKICGTTCLVTEHPYFRKNKFRLDFLFPNQFRYFYRVYIDIVATHKDLFVSYHNRGYAEAAYYVVNPLTKQFIVVPLTLTQVLDNIPWDIDYWPLCWVVGFAGVVEGVSTTSGLVPNSNDYNNNGFRIVRFVGTNAYVIQIYSSKTGQWTSDVWDNTGFSFGSSNKTVTLNDKVYYQGLSQVVIIDPFPDDFVAPRVLNLPDEINSGSVLGFSRNRLHIAQFEEHPNVSEDYPRIKVWEFEDSNELTITDGITKMAELRLIIDFPLKPSLFEGIMTPTFSIIPTIQRHRSDGVFCCHAYDPYIVYFSYGNTFYQYDVVKQKLKVVSYHVDDWTERHVFLHPYY